MQQFNVQPQQHQQQHDGAAPAAAAAAPAAAAAALAAAAAAPAAMQIKPVVSFMGIDQEDIKQYKQQLEALGAMAASRMDVK
jgi:hypothetical protein